MIQSGEFLGRLSGSLLQTRLQLIRNLITQLAKNCLVPPELTAVASAADAGIHKISYILVIR